VATVARGYCSLLAPATAIARAGAGTPNMQCWTATPIVLRWADGSTDSYGPDTASLGTAAEILSVYSGTPAVVDGRAFAWIIAASHGTPNLWLLKESDIATAGTLLGAISGAGEWAPLYRVDGDTCEKVDQMDPDISGVVTVDPAAGAPQDGDMLVFMAGKWELIHVPSGAARPGYTYYLDWNGTSPPNWREQANWKNRNAPHVSATHNICSAGVVNGQATNGTINLTVNGTIGAASSVLLADILYDSAYLTDPTVVLSLQQFNPHLLYYSSVTNTGFSIELCNPTGTATTPNATVICNYIIIPT
jgi:hypothetical protein